MTEKLNNGTLNRETSDHETQAAIREAAAGFLDVHLPDFSGNKAEVAAAKRGLLTVILKTAGRPMRVAEIKDIMDDLVERAGQEVAMANVSLQLTAMKNQGGVQLLERGVYAHNELDSRDYEKSMTIGENILAALDASETPLTTGEIKDYCLSHARQPISRESVDTELRIMSQRGAIKHLHTNAYAPAGFDSETYERSLTNQQLVVRILTEHNQPMTADGLVMAFKEVGRDAKVATVRSSLNKLYHQKRIRRLEDGVYACLDFNPDLYQTMNTMSQTLEVLNAEPKPMTAGEVAAGISRIFNRQIKKEDVTRRLSILAGQRRIKKLGIGVYACLSCDETVFLPEPVSPAEPKKRKGKPAARKRPPKNAERPSAGIGAKKVEPKRPRKKKTPRKPVAKRPTAVAKVREKIRLLAAIDDELAVEGVVADLEKDGQQVSETLRSFIKMLLERRNGNP